VKTILASRGIGGPDLTELFRKQAERFGTMFDYDIATEVDLSHRP
jgi:thioredoxin reductase